MLTFAALRQWWSALEPRHQILAVFAVVSMAITSSWISLEIVACAPPEKWPSPALQPLPAAAFDAGSTASPRALNDTAKDLLDRRFKLFEHGTDLLDVNMKFQTAFIILSLLILFSSESTFKLPVFDMALRVDYLQLIVPAALVFLWLRFGFALHNYIDNRTLLNAIAAQSVPPEWNANDAYSIRRLVRDGAFGDAWFDAFRHESFLTASPGLGVVNLLSLLLHGSMLGLGHAVAIALLVNRFTYGDRRGKREMAVHGVLVFVAVVCFWASHRQFYWHGPQPNWLQPYIVLFSTAALAALIYCSNTPKSMRIPPPNPAPAE